MTSHRRNANDEGVADDRGEDVDPDEFASLVTASRLQGAALEHLWLASTLECSMAFGSRGREFEGHASWR